jgi:hypothetical protein
MLKANILTRGKCEVADVMNNLASGLQDLRHQYLISDYRGGLRAALFIL